MSQLPITANTNTTTPWLRPPEAAARAQLAVHTLYREIRAGRLRAARVGGRREIRLRPEWVDAWLDASAPQEHP